MSQLTLDFDAPVGPWSGYGWIVVRGRRLFALVYHTWDRWFALPRDNPGLRRVTVGTIEHIEEFRDLVRPLTTREEK